MRALSHRWMGQGLIGSMLALGAAGCSQPAAIRTAPPPPPPPPGLEASKTAETPAEVATSPATPATANSFVLGVASGTITPLLGINMGPDPVGAGTVELTALYQERGITTIRTHDYKGAFDLTDPKYDATDGVLARMRAGGFSTYLRLGNSFGAGASTASKTELAKGMTDMLTHVQAGADKTRPVQYVEIWNEPDNKEFWTQGEDAYIDLYIEVAKQIRAKHPKVKIGGPALTPAGALTDRGRGFVERFLAAVKGADAPLDFITWHMYSNDPAAYVGAAKTYRDAAEKAGFGDIDQHVTEWNTAFKAEGGTPDGGARPGGKAGDGGGKRGDGQGKRGDGEGRRGDGAGKRGPGGGGAGGGADAELPADVAARQADKHDTQVRIGARASGLTTAEWIAMQISGVDQAYFYRGPDPAPYPSSFYGMFYNDGRPKPAGVAALLWKKMVDHPTRIAISGPATGPIWALAGRSSAGETTVLLANATAEPVSWDMACPLGSVLPIQTNRLRAPAETLEVGTQSDCSGTLDPWEVRSLSWLGGV